MPDPHAADIIESCHRTSDERLKCIPVRFPRQTRRVTRAGLQRRQLREDRDRCRPHSLTSGLHHFHRRLALDGCCPGRHIRDRVARCVEAVGRSDHQSHGLRFDLPDPAMEYGIGVVRAVQHHVRQLVRQRLRTRRGVYVTPNGNAPSEVVSHTVRSAEIAIALNDAKCVPVPPYQGRQTIPETLWCLAREQLRSGHVGNRDTARLRRIPHVCGPNADHSRAHFVVASRGLARRKTTP